MGWTKRVDALETLKHHRTALRKKAVALMSADLDDEETRHEAWAIVFEFFRIEAALGYGRRDAEGVKMRSEAPDIGPLVHSLLRYEKKFTWRVKRHAVVGR